MHIDLVVEHFLASRRPQIQSPAPQYWKKKKERKEKLLSPKLKEKMYI
jgi:hypothetical protein